ncbi:MAG: 3'(2'),5'-bisphosphate nucleotidase [Planctomycetes bacterium]|nr:3'(2'),5'-bisphosphate nucleotidase [Planctomycetota bacterium]
MANVTWQLELEVALAAVRTAMGVCRNVQATIRPEALAKQDRSPVTVADFASQAVICQALGEAFPNDPVMAEEDSAALRQPQHAAHLEQVVEHVRRAGLDADSAAVCGWIDRGRTTNVERQFWTLDPIDGTKGFLRREQYAVSLALIVEGRIVLGVLGCPNLAAGAAGATGGSPTSAERGSTSPTGEHQAAFRTGGQATSGTQARATSGTQARATSGTQGVAGVVLWAVRGGGAWLRTWQSDSAPRQVHASRKTDPALARLCESVERQHSSHDVSARIAAELGIAQPPLQMDSQAKYAAVARGEADIYLRIPTTSQYRENIWDHAGGVIIVEEAGGRVSDLDGLPLDFTLGRKLEANRGVVVSAAGLHEQVLEAVRRVGPE